jgi:hypothetical protein
MIGGRILSGVLAALLWSLPAAGLTAPAQSLEYSVKANYLVRFAAFVDWPTRSFTDARSPVVLCVVGRDPFDGALDQAARSQTAYGRPLVVRRPATAAAAAACHILYVGPGGANLVPGGEHPVLRVTDAAVSSDRGMIHFVVSEGRVRFHIDLQAATRSRLSISSRLLNLALTVRGG